MTHVLTNYLDSTLDASSLSITHTNIENFLPWGWNTFGEIIWYTTQCYNVSIKYLRIHNGTLELSVIHDAAAPVVQQLLFELITTGLFQRSSKTCMMCGRFGQRRKLVEGKPALCGEHHIQYINAISED
jgi:hypothetical protein